MLYLSKPWELGPALSQNTQLTMLFAIPTESLTTLHCIDTGESTLVVVELLLTPAL